LLVFRGVVAVLGAGNIAQALAAHLAMTGQNVRLYNRWEAELAPLREKGGIQLSGALEGFCPLSVISTNIEEVVPGARVIFIATPANAHRYMAETCAPCLEEGQVVLFHPGNFGSSLEFARLAGSRALVAESASSLYIARLADPGAVKVLTAKTGIQVAAFPARHTTTVINRLSSVFPGDVVPLSSVLETGINNLQAVIHCPTVLFNFTRVEAGEEWLFYRGITEGVSNFIEAVDAERVALGQTLGVQTETLRQLLERSYSLSGLTMLETLHSVFSKGGGAKGPADRNHRYIFEDVPYALVPWASLGRQLGVPMPLTETLIDSFCAAYGQDLWSLGRTAEGMGLAGLATEQIQLLMREGTGGR
jgi:opine dehydrogenase